MKRLITLMALIAIAFTSQAQNPTQYNAKVGGRDTLTNAQADTTLFTVLDTRSDITIQADIRKISGTVAGSIKYFYSVDGGTLYYLAETDTLTDATNVYTYEKDFNPGIKYMVICATTGTSVASSEVWLKYRK